jgi:hypothetical protein
VTQEIVTLITQLGPNWRAILSSMWEEPELPEILRGAHDFEVVDKARRRSRIAAFAGKQVRSRNAFKVLIDQMLVARTPGAGKGIYRVVCSYNTYNLAFLTIHKTRIRRDLWLLDFHEAKRSSNLPISLSGGLGES